jgi:hypothetical protein
MYEVQSSSPKTAPKNKQMAAMCQRLLPLILAAPEAEIRRIVVQSHLGQIVCETLSQKQASQKMGWWSDSRCMPWIQTPETIQKQRWQCLLGNIPESSILFYWSILLSWCQYHPSVICFNDDSVVLFEVRCSDTTRIVLFTHNCFAYSQSFVFPH